MPKGKLNVDTSDLGRLQAAASFCDVQLGDGNSIGSKAVIEVSCKQLSSMFEMGRLIDTISNQDLEEFEAETEENDNKK